MRRQLKALVFVLLLLSHESLWARAGQAAHKQRPFRNVLVMMGDDHAAYAVGCYGNKVIRTPNLDRLAQQGVRFTQAFANSPICVPSRQSIITGKYPHANGVSVLMTPLGEDQVTVADYLKQFGFATGAVGKMHFHSKLKHGFDYRFDEDSFAEHVAQSNPAKPPRHIAVKPQWRPFADPARVWLNSDALPYPLYDRDMRGTWYASKAKEFLQANREKPFCLWLSFNEPHSPFDFPVEYSGRYKPEDMPLPRVGPEDNQWVPLVFKGISDSDKRGIVSAYYTSVEYLDKNVGSVLKKLRDLGLDENTLVIYVGDHGYLLGHHGRFEKHTMWDEALRVPLIMSSPGLRRAGGQTEALVELVDLVPTVLDALQIPPMENLHGSSLWPLLNGKTESHREMVFAEYLDDNKIMVRTQEWKYVFTSGKHDLALGYATGHGPSGRKQWLYNLRKDPGEFRDLCGNSKSVKVLERMQAKALEVFIKTDPRTAKLPKELSIEEKLEQLCDPPEAAEVTTR